MKHSKAEKTNPRNSRVDRPFNCLRRNVWLTFIKVSETPSTPAKSNKRGNCPRRYVIPVFKGLLSLLFLYAAFDKLLDISRFQLSMYKSPLLPPALIPPLSYLVPLSELLCVILLFHKKGHYGFIGSFIILGSFTLYITLLLPYPEGSICSCGALIEKMPLPQHLLFNLFFTAGAFAGIIQTDNSKTTPAVRGVN